MNDTAHTFTTYSSLAALQDWQVVRLYDFAKCELQVGERCGRVKKKKFSNSIINEIAPFLRTTTTACVRI